MPDARGKRQTRERLKGRYIMPRRKRRAPEPDRGACVIYARFSSDKQRDESIEDQVRVCSDWAAGHGLTVVATYADRALSGTSDERPEFLRMVADARSGNFGTVLVYKLDRFARDRFDAAVYRKRLAECGVELRSAMESIPEGPEGVILEAVIDGYNEYYSRNLAQNTLRGMMGNADNCLVNGVRVYGYRTGADGRYEVDEGEAAFVRGAFERVAAGEGRTAVVAWLNAEGSRNVRGNPWNLTSLRTMLTNEKYRGVYSFNGVRREGGVPRVVTDELFDAVQASMTRKPRQNRFLLAGRLYDAATGAPYRGTGGTGCSGRKYLYYSVPTGDGHERRYPKGAVEDAAVAALSRAFADRGLSERVARAAVLAMESDGDSPAVRQARRRLAEISRSEANILRAVEAGVVPPGTDRRLAELAEERARLERRVEEAAVAVPTVEDMAEWVRTRLCRRDPESLLRHAASRATIDEGGVLRVEIPWRETQALLERGVSAAQKIGERPARGQFAEFEFGSPGHSARELRVIVSATSVTVTTWVGEPCGRARAS